MPAPSKLVKKEKYDQRVCQLLDDHDKAFLVIADNVGSKQFMEIRAALRPVSTVLMGKNTMMRRCIRSYCERKGDDSWLALEKQLVGNVGVIFTKGDLNQVRSRIGDFVVPAPARVGAVAPCDVVVCAGPTGMDPSQTTFFQTLNVATKINKGSVEIISDVTVVKEGERVTSSASTLLGKMKMMPFTYGLIVDQVYQSGAMFSVSVLDIDDAEVVRRFMTGVNNVAAFSMAFNYPTLASIPHNIVNGYKNVLALSLASDYTFELAQKVKDYLANPSAFVSAAPVAAAGGGAAKAAAKAPEPEPEEEEEEDMGFDLFD